MAFGHALNRLANSLLAVALAGTGLAAIRRFAGIDSRVIPVRGHTIAIMIADSSGAVTRLSDVARGKCVEVIVYSPTCWACMVLAQHWRQDLASDPHMLPEGWRAVWLSLADMNASSGLEAPSSPVMHRFAPPGTLAALAVPATPFQIVLDTNGKVVASGIGADAASTSSYQRNCTLLNPSARWDDASTR